PLASHCVSSLPRSPPSSPLRLLLLFFSKATATTETYTLSLHALFRSHDARAVRRLEPRGHLKRHVQPVGARRVRRALHPARQGRSEEHTSELQSLTNLVCRLLLEKKK